MKILVTGATGFIGNHVVLELLKINKHEIITTAIDQEIPPLIKWRENVQYIPCDLNVKKDNFFTFFNEPDLMIHLSWEGVSQIKELFHIDNNLYSNYNFIKIMVENGLKNVSAIGTCFEYGIISGCLSEDLIPNPTTPYGIAKDSLRRFIEQLKKKFEFEFKWIRLFYMYGEGQASKSILPLLDKALDNGDEEFNMSGGEQLRDYLPVKKVAEYIVKIALQNNINGIINCCSGKPISIRTLVENHIKKRNKSIKLNLGYYPYPDYVPMAFWGDNTILKKLTSE